MAKLCGKGIWVLYSADVRLAFEMAVRTGATYLLLKTGHRGMFFPRVAGRACEHVRSVGLTPFAWQVVCCGDPGDEVRVVQKTVEAGYEGVVLDLAEQSAGRGSAAKELGLRLVDAGINPRILYFSGAPNISQHADVPYAEMSAFCQGGFMPRCFPSLGKPAEVAIHKLTYEEHARWCEELGRTVPLYPILAGIRDETTGDPLTPREFARWVDVLTEHKPSFVSIFRAGTTNRDLWLALHELSVPRLPRTVVLEPAVLSSSEPAGKEAPDAPSEEADQAVYVIAQPDDTVLGLCVEYGCTRDQFWEWNGSLWDGRGWPRDPDYMQSGWRVRVK